MAELGYEPSVHHYSMLPPLALSESPSFSLLQLSIPTPCFLSWLFLLQKKKKKETSRREHPHALTWLPANLPPAPGLIIHPAPLPVTMGELSRVLTKNQLLWSTPHLYPCLVKVATTAVSPFLSYISFTYFFFFIGSCPSVYQHALISPILEKS